MSAECPDLFSNRQMCSVCENTKVVLVFTPLEQKLWTAKMRRGVQTWGWTEQEAGQE